jgi:hypothetical protein
MLSFHGSGEHNPVCCHSCGAAGDPRGRRCVRELIAEAATRVGSGLDSIIMQFIGIFGPGVAPIMNAVRWLQTRNGAIAGLGVLVLILVLLRRPAKKQ